MYESHTAVRSTSRHIYRQDHIDVLLIVVRGEEVPPDIKAAW